MRDLSDRVVRRDGRGVFLDSYIVSATPYEVLKKRWGGSWVEASRERFARTHVLFEDDLVAGISTLIEPRDELERRISASYPYPLAHGFRSLTRTADPRDLYREQLRFAENLLAFLASVSLALLRAGDRPPSGLDLKRLWSGGISPGDWREIIQRCSKVFAGYRDIPLAGAIQRLKIGSEEKGFGRDVIELIRAKNDYKHDRAPTDPKDMASASDEAQERLRRCMQALSFFSDYQIRRVQDTAGEGDSFAVNCLRYVGDHPILPVEAVTLRERPREGGLFLDPGGRSWVSLYPFIVAANPPGGEPDTYFIDAWNTRKDMVRMKSFERGHAISDAGVAEALMEWSDGSTSAAS